MEQSNKGARDLGILNVDTDERKPANQFTRRRNEALPLVSIHSLLSLIPLAPAPSGILRGSTRPSAPRPATSHHNARFLSTGAHSPTD